MYNFFIDKTNIIGDLVNIDGEHFNHILNVLRMKVNDQFLVSFDQSCHLCQIKEIFASSLTAQIIQRDYLDSNLSIDLYLFQGLPKSDKLELIIQKAVELGAVEIIPVMTKRCIVKLEDEKKEAKKIERWQAIAESAAKQSGRGIIPKVSHVMSYGEALKKASLEGMSLIPYELAEGMTSLKEAIKKASKENVVSVFIGPEGGFEEAEIEKAKECDVVPVSLGKRILRTETAGFTTLSILMYEIECASEE